jgi:hypothetical protein
MVAGKKRQSIYWNGSSVRQILENPHYTGDMVQGRETTISVTYKARREKSETEFIVVKNTHESIISHEVFETVQQLIASNRRRYPIIPAQAADRIRMSICSRGSSSAKIVAEGFTTRKTVKAIFAGVVINMEIKLARSFGFERKR